MSTKILFRERYAQTRRIDRFSEPVTFAIVQRSIPRRCRRFVHFSSDDRGRAFRRLHRCPYEPGNNPDKTRDGRHAAQKVQWLAARSPNISPEFPVMEPNGSRSLPPDHSSLPDGKACNVSGSNILVPEKMPGPQR